MIATQLQQGVLPSDIDPEHKNVFEKLQKLGAVVEENGRWTLHSLYRIGRIYIGKDGKGFVEAQFKEQRDLLVEPDNLNDAKRGDIVVAKRFLARRGRTSGKVVLVLKKAHAFTLAYTHRDPQGNVTVLDLRTALPTEAHMRGITLNTFKIGTVFKVDTDTSEVIEILGHLDDPNVDEKIALALFDRRDAFPPECIEEAKGVESAVDASEYPDRIDLRELDFCTIDPVTAKDFDDAIYFDLESHTLYVAIADVSHYVPFFSPIDREAVQRGFTTYLPHKSFPMLPRELSENICSLKPRVDRLAFVAKITLDPETLEPTREEFFEAIIHSKFRFHYDAVDGIFKGLTSDDNRSEAELSSAGLTPHHYHGDDPAILRILTWLLPLQKQTEQLRAKRMKDGFDFRSEEVKLTLNDAMLLDHTQIESGTPSHSLIEECMLLANQAAAKRFEGDGDGIFRIHEPPQIEKIEALLAELAAIGLYVEHYDDSPSLIRAIQAEAERMDLAAEVDDMIIRSLRQASYSAHNVGHFGLGFEHYSHFTSPIRRYADLLLHRLIKTQLAHDTKESGYLLRNIDPLCVRISELERKATKAEWDFRDRKFARWAQEQKGKFLDAEVVEIDDHHAKARLTGDIQGVEVHLQGDKVMLFDKIRVMITEVDIAQATIMAEKVSIRN